LKTLCKREVVQIAQRAGLRVVVTGSGQVIDQKPPAGLPVDSGTSIRVKLGPAPSGRKRQG
jgi:beta-lactam-binding protein with PASTA domain